MQSKGFTLLELLLVVGIASILIVAGITTYNIVSQNNQINETVRLINILTEQTRRLYANTNSYGGNTNNIESALHSSGGIPLQYLDTSSSNIISPFSVIPRAVQVVGAPGGGAFRVALALPPNVIPEIAARFEPLNNNQINYIVFCGTSSPSVVDITAVATACGDSRVVPATENLLIEFF